jgi:hypothetical protein
MMSRFDSRKDPRKQLKASSFPGHARPVRMRTRKDQTARALVLVSLPGTCSTELGLAEPDVVSAIAYMARYMILFGSSSDLLHERLMCRRRKRHNVTMPVSLRL